MLGRRHEHQKYLILLSNIVDAMETSPNGARFYIGHELGHVMRHDNPAQAVLRWPALRLPLLGAAFSRARESTVTCTASPAARPVKMQPVR